MEMASTARGSGMIGHNDDDAMDSAEESGSIGLSNSMTAQSIDLPLDAHLLPGCGWHFYSVLLVIYITHPNNIVPLLAKVLCQRRV